MKSLFLRFVPHLGSIRTRLMVWNVLSLALILGVAGGIIQYKVNTGLLATVDHDLAAKVPHFMDRFLFFMHPHFEKEPGRNFAPPSGPLPGSVIAASAKPHAAPQPRGKHLEPSALEHSGKNTEMRFRPRFLDREGRSMPPFPGAPGAWDISAFQRSLKGQEGYTTVVSSGEDIRVFSRPVRHKGVIVGVFQIVYPLNEVERALGEMRRTLLTLIPVALLLAGFGGAALTDRALRPMRHIVQAAEQIGAHDLSLRLPEAGSDEFTQMAATFNGMLGRLESAFQQKSDLVNQLEALIEQQRRFTGDASHELRTPLTVIKANTTLSLNGKPDVEEYREALEDIDQAANTMTRLVQDLLLLTRSDGEQLGKNVSRVQVREIAETAARNLRGPCVVPVHISVPEDTLPVMGNVDELTRLFVNLLENAARATLPEGEIRIAAYAEKNNVHIEIADTGCGIDAQHLPHLFERFYRVDAARARPDGGTGLGLAISKSIVEAHRGAIAIESSLGKGTLVHITLPLARKQALA